MVEKADKGNRFEVICQNPNVNIKKRGISLSVVNVMTEVSGCEAAHRVRLKK